MKNRIKRIHLNEEHTKDILLEQHYHIELLPRLMIGRDEFIIRWLFWRIRLFVDLNPPMALKID